MPSYSDPSYSDAPYSGEGFAGRAWPVVTVEADLTNDPTSDVVTWTQLGECLAFSCSRGRTYELDRSEAGTAQVTLDNTDGRFDPTNTASPYNSGGLSLRLRARIRIRATWAGVTYDVWRGFVERWPQAYMAAGFASLATIACTGPLTPLQQGTLPSTVSAQILDLDPLVYYPLTEPEGATQAGDASRNNHAPATILTGKYTSANSTVTFGTETGLAEDAGTSVHVIPDTGAFAFQLPTTALPDYTAGLTVVAFTSTATTNERLPVVVGVTHHVETSGSAITTSGFSLDANNLGHPYFAHSHGVDTTVEATYATDIRDGEWHSIIGVLSADRLTAKIYVDGVLRDTDTRASASTPETIVSTQFAGSISPYGQNGYDGSLSHVAIIERPLTADEVLAVHNAGFNGFTGDTSGERIGRILDFADWPTADRDIAGGTSLIGPVALTGQNPGEATGNVADWEAGHLYETKDGKVAFRGREDRWNRDPTGTFGEDEAGGEWPYLSDLFLDYDLQHVYSDVEITRTGGITARTHDAESATAYFPRTYAQEISVTTDGEAIDRAGYLCARYAQPELRVGQVTIDPSSNPNLWAVALGGDIGDCYTVKRRAPGNTISLDTFVERVEHQVTADSLTPRWLTTFGTSPAQDDTFWLLEDATFGQIDQPGIRIAY